METEIFLVNKEECENGNKSTKSKRDDEKEVKLICGICNHNLIYLNPIKKIILHGCCT